MPFYLVTQTSLIEADNEQAAAQRGIDKIRSGGQVTVAVKFDEAAITHVVVPAETQKQCTVPISDRKTGNPSVPMATDIPGNEVGKRQILKRMMADALALMARRH